MSQCRIKSSHGRGIYMAVIMSESLELPHVLQQKATHPCYNNLQLWNAKLCRGEILPALPPPPPQLLWQRQKRSKELHWEKEASAQQLFPCTPNLCQLWQGTWLYSLDFSKGVIGAAELITSKSWTCSFQLLVRVWQKSCRNPCLGGEAAAGSWDLQTPGHVFFQQWESLEERLSSAAKFQGRKLYPSTIKEIKVIKCSMIQ